MARTSSQLAILSAVRLDVTTRSLQIGLRLPALRLRQSQGPTNPGLHYSLLSFDRRPLNINDYKLRREKLLRHQATKHVLYGGTVKLAGYARLLAGGRDKAQEASLGGALERAMQPLTAKIKEIMPDLRVRVARRAMHPIAWHGALAGGALEGRTLASAGYPPAPNLPASHSTGSIIVDPLLPLAYGMPYSLA